MHPDRPRSARGSQYAPKWGNPLRKPVCSFVPSVGFPCSGGNKPTSRHKGRQKGCRSGPMHPPTAHGNSPMHPPTAVWLNRFVTSVNHDLNLYYPGWDNNTMGSVVISLDGSSKGGHDMVSCGLRHRGCILGQSEYGVHPVGIASIKEKDKPLQYVPLQCYLVQLRYIVLQSHANLKPFPWIVAANPMHTPDWTPWRQICLQGH